MLEKKLAELRNTDIETVDRNDLAELTTVQIRQELSHEEKILDYIEQIKNPYCFLCNGTPVKICFSEDGPTLGEALERYFIRIKQG